MREGISEDEFVEMRTARDGTLGMPRLIVPSVQVNMRAGEMPPLEDNGVCYSEDFCRRLLRVATGKDPHMQRLLALAVLVAFSGAALGQQGGHGPISPYAGEEVRAIRSLSEADIAELRRGGGWGLAKAAELNGVPGPAHLLELQNEIPLSAEQVAAIGEIFATMKAKAIAEGERLIAGEQELENAFRSRSVTDEKLRRMLTTIEQSRSALRYVHLAAHLETMALLSEDQIARYNALRGYGSHRCADVPPGHDPTMWRRHNGCD